MFFPNCLANLALRTVMKKPRTSANPNY